MVKLQYLKYARDRLQAFLDEIDRLKESEFPHNYSRDGLNTICSLFKTKQKRLTDFDNESDPEIVKLTCARTIKDLYDFLPILGFILRSTNVRNAFEVYGPLLQLAGDLLEPGTPQKKRKTKLILSSEWNYSPHMYKEKRELQGFVLIGLPAMESSNPLLIPLAGHELGHFIWVKKQLDNIYLNKLVEAILESVRADWQTYEKLFGDVNKDDLENNLFANKALAPVFIWGIRQTQEIFCDLIGLRIFGKSYMHAYAYLVSPNIAGPRSNFYPNMLNRVKNLTLGAKAFDVDFPADYEDMFEDSPDPPNITDNEKLLLELADIASGKMVNSIIEKVIEITEPTSVAPNKKNESKILKRFEMIVPAEKCGSLIDILNAAWKAYSDPGLWKNDIHVKKYRDKILKDLVLKNIELLEIEHKTGRDVNAVKSGSDS